MAEQNTFNYINYYCERGSNPAFFAEPLNYLTNAAFMIAMVYIFSALKKNNLLKLRSLDVIILAIILGVIGIGSAAFHSVPNQRTLLMDVIPIAIFIHLYIPVFFSRVIGLRVWQSVLVLFLFIGAGMLADKTFDPSTLNGTIMYVPTYAMLLIMSLIIFFTKKTGAKYLLTTTFIWTFSLIFRTFDSKLCEATDHIGTHFMWHLINAVVLYRCLKLVVLSKINSSIS